MTGQETVAGRFRPWRYTLHTEKQRGRTPYASFFSIHLWIPRVLIVPRGKDHHNGTQTRPFVSLPKRMPRPGERGQQLSPSSHLPRCFAVPPGRGKKQPSTLPCGRRTDARLGYGVVAIHSGSYWIINTLDFNYCLFAVTNDFLFLLSL
ncbi:hypothetical protein [Aneurinibacillus migulanus]|uniref:hypothetical protein n=1 Tax=Aneurinibacillus migulanus TaxID=47500 RepID=UPI001F18594D|nr:hypothetical protein [Aneurinibacillus migulanus]